MFREFRDRFVIGGDQFFVGDLPSHAPGVAFEEARGTEPLHEICPKCYEDRRKSPLQRSETRNGLTRLHCPSCDRDFKIGRFVEPRVERRKYGPRFC